MTILLTILHVAVCLLLIVIVLAQQGKGQDLASAFGGGGSQTTFGARGTATLLSKVTTVLAVLFMITSLGLTYLRPVAGGRTVVPGGTPPPAQEQPSPVPGVMPEEGAPSETPEEGTAPPSDETTEGEGESQTEPPSETPPPEPR